MWAAWIQITSATLVNAECRMPNAECRMPNAECRMPECLAIDNPGSKTRHSRKGGSPPHHPPFLQRQESTPSPAIPAKAGIYPISRHSREGGNPQFPRTREFIVPLHQSPKKHSAIPACAEIHPITRHSCKGGNHHPITSAVIPAKAGIHNSRARGNSSSHYIKAQKKLRHSRMRGNPPHHPPFLQRQESNPPHHPSFPRRRESTIPAHAGIHRPITSKPKKTLRHSRKGGNPPHHPPFLQRQESTPSAVIPAFAGMTECFCGNDVFVLLNFRGMGHGFPRRME